MKTSSASILGTAERLFKPLIREKLFKDYDELLKNLLIIYINQQINAYQNQIKALERKYQLSFEEFTRAIKGKASCKDEVDWLDWEDALLFLKKWQKIKDEVLHAAVE
ncbi:MAG: hypothetical protein ONB11_03725 [candidate division KSB1 bacterium]|nr:hypothetical protein [candidate division KSB1 bacterium]MDZ7341214.1 hypothetical protein [candidate division KSB1 bacterium]